MNRTHQILLGLLALQLVLIVVLRSPFASSSAGGSSLEPLMPELEAITPSRIELLGKDDEHVGLSKGTDGWVVDEAGGYPADTSKIDELLDDLKSIRVRRPIVSSARYHEAFKVEDDDYEGRLRVYAEGDTPKVDLILGDSPNYRITHARRADQDRVYEVRDLAPYDVRAAVGSWADKELVDIPLEDVVELELTNASGTFRLARDAENGWQILEPASLVETSLDDTKVDSLIRAAASLRIDEPVGPVDEEAQGLVDPAATVILRWLPAGSSPEQGENTESAAVDEVVVRVGGKPEDKDTHRYVTRSGFGFTGTVWESSVSRLLDQKPGDLAAES